MSNNTLSRKTILKEKDRFSLGHVELSCQWRNQMERWRIVGNRCQGFREDWAGDTC
jgi:hypothetical protein